MNQFTPTAERYPLETMHPRHRAQMEKLGLIACEVWVIYLTRFGLTYYAVDALTIGQRRWLVLTGVKMEIASATVSDRVQRVITDAIERAKPKGT